MMSIQLHIDIRTPWFSFLRPALLVGLLCLVGCSTPPIGVTRVGTKEAHRLFTASVLSTGTPSEHSLQVLSRLDLREQFEDDPAAALAALHTILQSTTDSYRFANRLFALAELSFLTAEHQHQRQAQTLHCQPSKGWPCPPAPPPHEKEKTSSYYLAAAVYAYAFLFPDDPADASANPADPRLRLAYDLYNRGLAEGLTAPGTGEVMLASGQHQLPFGVLEIEFMSGEFTWAGYKLEHFVPTADFAVRGLRNRYRRAGIGAALAASLAETPAAVATVGANRIPPRLKVPATAFLRLAAPRRGLATGTLRGQLELYTPSQAGAVTVNGQQQPLEVESTAALAYTLQGSRAYAFEVGGFLKQALKSYFPEMKTQDGLFFLQPPRPDRIPVVLVHGTASSPARWAELINELAGDPRLRARYQIWLFIYETGNPIAYSGGRLRQALQNVVQEVDPEGTAEALRHMVVMGHSQGGLLTKLTVINSGSRFWDNISKTPLEDLTIAAETRELLRRSLFVTPLPFVTRVVFISTPHRGSYQAALRLGRLSSWLVTLPGDLTKQVLTTMTQNQDKVLVQKMEKLPTSVDNMNPSHPFITTLASIPVADGVKAHSIIPVLDEGPLSGGDDGIVAYDSAHIDGLTSELVVRGFGHSVQGHPQAIEEIRRILTDHLKELEGVGAGANNTPD